MPEHKNFESDQNKAAPAKEVEHNSLFEDFYQSMAYTTVQRPYDGVSQLVNHLGGNMKPKQLVEAPEAADVGSANWMAQQAGSGVAALAAILALHRGIGTISSSLGRTAGSVALTESALTGKVTAKSLAASGALYEGLTSTSSENNFWKDRAVDAGIGGLSMYAMARTQIGLQNVTGVSRIAPETLSGLIGRQLGNSGIGVFSGAAGGALSAEGSSLLKHGKLASPGELAERTISGAFLGGTLSLATRPGAEPVSNRFTGYSKPTVLESLTAKTAQPIESVGPGNQTRLSPGDGVLRKPAFKPLPEVFVKPKEVAPSRLPEVEPINVRHE